MSLAPSCCLHKEWTLVHAFPSFIQFMTPIERLDLMHVPGFGHWSFDGLDKQRLFANIVDLRLDPTYEITMSAEWSAMTSGIEMVPKLGYAITSDTVPDRLYMIKFLRSVKKYFAAMAGHLKRLHWSIRSPALNCFPNSCERPRPWLPSLTLLTNLTHLETDMASLFGRPSQVCSSYKLVDLLPPSLKVLKLAETWYRLSKPCKHHIGPYLRALYGHLTGLVQARETRFLGLESVTLFFVDWELPDEPDWEWYNWWTAMNIGHELRWTPEGLDDPFGVLNVQGVAPDAVVPVLCFFCVCMWDAAYGNNPGREVTREWVANLQSVQDEAMNKDAWIESMLDAVEANAN
jgi:hypothetical protein